MPYDSELGSFGELGPYPTIDLMSDYDVGYGLKVIIIKEILPAGKNVSAIILIKVEVFGLWDSNS